MFTAKKNSCARLIAFATGLCIAASAVSAPAWSGSTVVLDRDGPVASNATAAPKKIYRPGCRRNPYAFPNAPCFM